MGAKSKFLSVETPRSAPQVRWPRDHRPGSGRPQREPHRRRLCAAPRQPSRDSHRAIDFNREIRPLLSDKCDACHGPDEKTRKAGLRFDQKQDAYKALKSGEFALVPGDPRRSKLIERIHSRDEEEKMPPSKTRKTLTPREIELLERWISKG